MFAYQSPTQIVLRDNPQVRCTGSKFRLGSKLLIRYRVLNGGTSEEIPSSYFFRDAFLELFTINNLTLQ